MTGGGQVINTGGGFNAAAILAAIAGAQRRVVALESHTAAPVLYVQPNSPAAVDAGNTGEDPAVPLATMAAALALCQDFRGNVIEVGNNDAWIYGSGSDWNAPINEAVTVNVGGVKIIGAMAGNLPVPWISPNAAAPCITVNAPNVEIANFNFQGPANGTGVLAQWSLIGAVYGDNLLVRDCFFGPNLDYGVRLDYSWFNRILRCRFHNIGQACIDSPLVYGNPDFLDVDECEFVQSEDCVMIGGNYFCNVHDCLFTDVEIGVALTGSDECVVKDNVMNITDWATAAITGVGATGCVIDNNKINGDPNGANNYIDLTNGTDNLVSNNWLACTIAQYDATCSGGAPSGSWVRNHCVNGDTAAAPL